MTSFSVNTYSSNNEFIYVHPGTIDAISLDTIYDGDKIVVVKNSLRMIYLYQNYTYALYAMINSHGLGDNELIDPSVPFSRSAIPIHYVKYYTAKMITPDSCIPSDALITENYGL
jgi:hypothetical protein